MSYFKLGVCAYVAMMLALFVLLFMLAGCSTLREGESRKITAWGIWAVVMGAPIGVGYWHSERGDDVKSETSAKPPVNLNSGTPMFVPAIPK